MNESSGNERWPVPWLLHGGGAPFSEIDSVTVISMRCAISGVTIKLSQLLLTCLPKTAMTSSSMKPLWEAIAGGFTRWQMKGLVSFFVVAGDLEWFSAEFGWLTAMSNHPCPYCKADNLFDMEASKHPFTDFRKDARWKTTLKGVHSPPPVAHPLFKVVSVCWVVAGKPGVLFLHMWGVGWKAMSLVSVCWVVAGSAMV